MPLLLLLLSCAQQLILTQEMERSVRKKVFKKVDEQNMAWEVEHYNVYEPETTQVIVYHAPWPRTNAANPLVLQPITLQYLWYFAQLFTNYIFIRLLA